MDVLKMVKLDFYTIKPQAIVSALVAVVILMFFGSMFPSYDVLGITCAWIIPVFTISIFQVQEKDSLDRLYSTLSLKQKDIVLGRYLSIVIAYALLVVVSLAVFVGFTLYHGTAFDPINLLFGMSFSLLFFSLIMGAQIPLNFKFGYTKARYLSLIPLIIVAVIVIGPTFWPYVSDVLSFIFNNQALLIPFLVIASAIVLVVSYRISVRAYRKRG